MCFWRSVRCIALAVALGTESRLSCRHMCLRLLSTTAHPSLPFLRGGVKSSRRRIHLGFPGGRRWRRFSFLRAMRGRGAPPVSFPPCDFFFARIPARANLWGRTFDGLRQAVGLWAVEEVGQEEHLCGRVCRTTWNIISNLIPGNVCVCVCAFVSLA